MERSHRILTTYKHLFSYLFATLRAYERTGYGDDTEKKNID